MVNKQLKDYRIENRRFNRRIIFSAFLVTLMLGILLWRMIFLQILSHEHFTTLARDNQVKLIPQPPTRGLIYDRNGIPLAENLPAFSLEITPEKVPDNQIDATIETLATIIEINDADTERFHKLRKQKRRFESIPIRVRITPEEAALFAVNKHRFPGVEIAARLTRIYPQGLVTAHAMGYVGRISQKDLQTIAESEYAGTTHIGKTGVEKSYESVLHGKVGYQQVEVNALGKLVRVLEESPPVPGSSLRLNLDVKLQQVTMEAFGEENGAAVAIDPKNGGVLALVSKPGFDPNLFVEGISSADYQALQQDDNNPLYDRALRGQYPPGSTVKPFVGLAGLENHNITEHTQKFCIGFYQLPGHKHKYRDWKKGGHGATDLDKAITQSCDTFFYQLAHDMGIDSLQEYLTNFNFGEKTGIDLVGEQRGVRPSRQWKRKRYNQTWYPGETVIMGIGQGYFLTTPLQLAAATAAIANDGIYFSPRVVNEIINEDTNEATKIPPVINDIPIGDQENWERIKAAMINVVEGERGTAKRIANNEYRIAGKTGTAQVFTVKQEEEYDEEAIEKKMRDHALFIAYAPVDNPRIAVAVIVENGGHGGSTAAPIAKRMMDAYLLGEPL